MTSPLHQMELKLFDQDKWAYYIYQALKNAPDQNSKATLWNLLSPDQQAALRILAKQSNQMPATDHTPAPDTHTGPTRDHYGKRL